MPAQQAGAPPAPAPGGGGGRASGGGGGADLAGGWVLVTGGCGFIGSHAVGCLLGEGCRVRVLDNLSTGCRENLAHLTHLPSLEVVEGDIRDLEVCRRAMEGVTEVIHLGAQSKVLPSMLDPTPSMARFCLDNNVVGTNNVLQAAWESGGVRRVVYAGSSTYYGSQDPPHHEGLPPDLGTPYAASKYQGEVLAGMFARVYGLPTVTLRFFMVYGPRQPREGPYAIVTGVFLRQASQGEALTIEGDGEQTRDFVHVRDVADALMAALRAGGLGRGEVINVGSGTETSIKSVAAQIAPKHVHLPGRPFDLKRTRADCTRARELLGWEARVPFSDGLQELMDLEVDAAGG